MALLATLLASLMLLCVWCSLPGGGGQSIAEARYFPTRSDDTSVQVLRDLIRSVSSIGQWQKFATCKQ